MNLLYDPMLESEKGNLVLNLFSEPELLKNVFYNNIKILKENSVQKIISDTYKFKPEQLALEEYGSEKLYPVILIANDLGSVLQFIPDNMNNLVNIPSLRSVQEILRNR
jgi:hypothetical protein